MKPQSGEFDPADEVQLAKLMFEATKRAWSQVECLSPADRADALAQARAAAVVTAGTYGRSEERTTKWRKSANAATYALRKFLDAEREEAVSESDLARSLAHVRGDVLGHAGESVFQNDDDDDGDWEPGDGPRESIDEVQERIARIALLRQLDERSARIVELDDAGWKAPQIAEDVGMTPDAVRKNLERWRDRLDRAARGLPSALPPDPGSFVAGQPDVTADRSELPRLPRSFAPD